MPESPDPPPPPPPGPTPAPAGPGLPAAHGSRLVAPVRAGEGGGRTAACPVCLTTVPVPAAGRGWANVRCDSCGCEFIASDGSLPPPPPPPPPPPAPKPEPTAKVAVAGSRILSLILIGDGGRRVVRCPTCHAIEPVPFAGGRGDVRCRSCGTEFIASVTLAPPPAPLHPTAPPPPPARPAVAPPPPPPAGVVVADAVRTAPDGSRSVVCPLCGTFNVALPRVLPTFTIRVTCPGCRAPFTVDLRRARPRPTLPPAAERMRPRPRQTPKWAVFALITLGAGVAGYLLWHVVAAALALRNFGE